MGKRSKQLRVVILASTRGTDFGALLKEQAQGKLKGVEFVGLIANRECDALERARLSKVPTFLIAGNAPDFAAKLLVTVRQLQPDLICLIGFLKILSPEFCQAFQNKILNVHPSLLPKYAGGLNLDVHAALLKNKEKETGMTIHLVTSQVDAGPIICQKSVPVDPTDTPERLKAKVQALEKKWYPEVVRWFRDGKLYF